MTPFRILLTLMFVTMFGYSAAVAWQHGAGLFPIFFGDMAKLTWSGQFNLDFMCLLALSGLWVSYRHGFRVIGIILGVCAAVGGVLFLSAYLLVESFRCNGDVSRLLLGTHRT